MIQKNTRETKWNEAKTMYEEDESKVKQEINEIKKMVTSTNDSM